MNLPTLENPNPNVSIMGDSDPSHKKTKKLGPPNGYYLRERKPKRRRDAQDLMGLEHEIQHNNKKMKLSWEEQAYDPRRPAVKRKYQSSKENRSSKRRRLQRSSNPILKEDNRRHLEAELVKNGMTTEGHLEIFKRDKILYQEKKTAYQNHKKTWKRRKIDNLMLLIAKGFMVKEVTPDGDESIQKHNGIEYVGTHSQANLNKNPEQIYCSGKVNRESNSINDSKRKNSNKEPGNTKTKNVYKSKTKGYSNTKMNIALNDSKRVTVARKSERRNKQRLKSQQRRLKVQMLLYNECWKRHFKELREEGVRTKNGLSGLTGVR